MTGEADRNIVLLCIDSLRKDIFDEFCSEISTCADISFEQCRAASSWSVPSHASLFTGDLPHAHGIHTYNQGFSDLDRSDTFLSSLDEYSILGASANVYAGSAFGFDELFDDFVDVDPRMLSSDGLGVNEFLQQTDTTGVPRIIEFLKALMTHTHPLLSLGNACNFALSQYLPIGPPSSLLASGAEQVTSESIRLIDAAEEPFFLFVNIMDVHGPLRAEAEYDTSLHSVPSTWDSRDVDDLDICISSDLQAFEDYIQNYRQLYRAAADYVDRIVANYIDDLHEQTDLETTVIVTSDHGENLGYDSEAGMFEHKMSLSEALLHVPCIISNAPTDQPSISGDYVSHLQMGDLVTGLSRGDVPDLSRDRIAAELIGIGPASLPSDVNHEYWNRMMRCVYEGDKKIVWDSIGEVTRYELNLTQSSWERVVGPCTLPVWVDDLFDEELSAYHNRVTSDDRKANIDTTAEDRLEDLGYL